MFRTGDSDRSGCARLFENDSPPSGARLQVHGVHPQQIKTIENFLLNSQLEIIPKRQPFTKPGINRIVIVSRLDPIKRVDLLFDALDYCPELAHLEFHIQGYSPRIDWH